MEHHQAGMARKWERHYNMSRTTCSYAFILFGISFAIPLLMLYPQKFAIDVFNSRLAFRLILDEQDYQTCSDDFTNFVIDEPPATLNLISFYLFNITNAANVLQRGDQPEIYEVGPYSYSKSTFKYDIVFEPIHSSTITFKEYVLLSPVVDNGVCKKMYNMLDKGFGKTSDPCAGGACDCRSQDEAVFVVNPLFLKLIWQESAHELLSRYSSAIFKNIKDLLEGEFVTAVKMHLVRVAFQEVYFFRQQNQMGPLLVTAINNLRYNATGTVLNDTRVAYLMETADGISKLPKTCGLSAYGINACPLNLFSYFATARTKAGISSNFSSSHIPSIVSLLNASNPYSFLNLETGLPRLLGLGFCLGYTTFNANSGYTMIDSADCTSMFLQSYTRLAVAFFGSSPSKNQLLGSSIAIRGLALFLIQAWFDTYGGVLLKLNYKEFATTYEPVVCSPLGDRCTWQWGYMHQYRGSDEVLTDDMVFSLIDYRSSGNTNPNSMFYDANSGPKYNSYKYCKIVYSNPVNYDKCLNISYTFNDALRYQPAALWGVDNGVTAINRTNLYMQFERQSDDVHLRYQRFSCNMSTLMFEVFPNVGDYHDQFVIKYLNKHNDPKFTHKFEVGKWEEIGWAQWGGGFITEAIVGVRSIYQVLRNGMWVIGDNSYITELVEFSSWGLYTAFPQTWIYNVTESYILLNAMSKTDAAGVAFKKHIIETSTTYRGDGVNFVNGVGAVGEVTFVTQQNLGNFSCTGESAVPCRILAEFFSSSAASCDMVQNTYDVCLDLFYQGNNWVANCDRFETAITSPTSGVQCDHDAVYFHDHPYTESRGNIIYSMLLQLTIHLILQHGLWCNSVSDCLFNLGGLFTTTTVRQVLFEGFTDPSVLKFLNLKHQDDGVNFFCAAGSVDGCGKTNLVCDNSGIIMELPNGESKLFKYGVTPHDEMFAPYFEIASDGEMLWRFSMNKTMADAHYKRATSGNEEITKIFNPFWAAHPAWHSGHVAFNKYLQCGKRQFSGLPGLFASCEDTLNTGSITLKKAMDIQEYSGNRTIRYFDSEFPVNGSTAPHYQHEMFLWDGFQTYPYTYFAESSKYYNLEAPSIFDKKYGLWFSLSQKTLTFSFQKDISMTFPVPTSWTGLNTVVNSTGTKVPLRRFVETVESWEAYQTYAKPYDSYGMRYRVPIGMASLERSANFPLFVGTPHCYGNELWGGTEFSDVSGYVTNKDAQRTYLDYEPISGKSFRTVVRQQINLRVERGPLMPNIISSQQRCLVPAKTFGNDAGYGCFAYVPLFWSEDARIQDEAVFSQLEQHFYMRPDRASKLTIIGVVIGFVSVVVGICIYIYEQFKKRVFLSRVYIDG